MSYKNPGQKMAPDARLMFCSMGKQFRVTAWFTDDDDANKYLATNRNEGVIASAGSLVLIANLYDAGKQDVLAADLLAALDRALPWLGKLIADNGHLNSVAPNDAIGAMQQAQAAIDKARGR